MSTSIPGPYNAPVKYFHTGKSARQGWARYDDGQYTLASKLTVIAGAAAVTLPNNAATKIETYMNSEIPYYSGTTNKVQMSNEGDVYQTVIVFKASSSSASSVVFTLSLDSTGTTPYERVSKTFKLSKGNNITQNIYESFHFYADADFVANGNRWKIECEGANLQVWDIIYFIEKTYAGYLND